MHKNVHARFFLTFSECKLCPCSSGSYTAVATDRVHGRVRAVYSAVYTPRTRPCTRPIHGSVHAVYKVVYADRVRGLVHDRVHGHTAVYTALCTAQPCTRAYTRPLHGRVQAVYTKQQLIS